MDSKLIAIVAIVAVALIGGYFLLQGGSDEQAMENDTPQQAMRETEEETMEDAMQQETIVAVASGNEDFSTLVTAVQEAGLVETLSSEGPFTVFAPTNAAFDKLPEGTLEDLLNNPDQLRDVLTYHVVSGEVTSGQVVDLNSATTVQGGELEIRVDNGTVYVNDAQVVTTDIQASNGVIHVIDTVLIP